MHSIIGSSSCVLVGGAETAISVVGHRKVHLSAESTADPAFIVAIAIVVRVHSSPRRMRITTTSDSERLIASMLRVIRNWSSARVDLVGPSGAGFEVANHTIAFRPDRVVVRTPLSMM
jgi:hypothetical protein